MIHGSWLSLTLSFNVRPCDHLFLMQKRPSPTEKSPFYAYVGLFFKKNVKTSVALSHCRIYPCPEFSQMLCSKVVKH